MGDTVGEAQNVEDNRGQTTWFVQQVSGIKREGRETYRLKET